MRRRIFVGLVTMALAASPLACGDDDDVSSDTTAAAAASPAATEGDATAQTEAPPPDDTEAGATEETEAGDTTPDDTDASEVEVSGGDLDRWCEISDELGEIDLSEAPSPEETEDAFNEMEDRADEFIEVSPDEIRDDAESVVGTLRDIRDLLESHDWDINEAATDPAFAETVTSEFDEAGTRLDEFEAAHCS